jgi:AcrR family transcriptional regulator
MTTDQLDRDAWIRAGLDTLERGGVAAVAVVPIARELGVTRGSFYWHFTSRDELLAAVLERWERDHSDAVLDELEAIADPRERLRALLHRSGSKAPSYFVRLLDAAGTDPLVRATLDRSAARRLEVIARACRQAGMTPAGARHHALLCYAAYVGLAQLGRDAPQAAPRERAAFARHLAATLIPPE